MTKQGKHPLKGKRIVVTRSSDQTSELRERFELAGAEVLEIPLIRIERDVDPKVLEDAFGRLATYEWIVFTSPNGVRHFMDIFIHRFKDIRAFGPARIACVGKSTAKALKPYHLLVDLMPETAVAEALGEALLATDSLDSANVLVVTGSRNRDVLPKMLEEQGRAIVDTVQVYRTDFTDLQKNPSAELFRKEGADVITFTSSSTAESFLQQAKHLQIEAGGVQPKTASIGSITSRTMQEKGLPVHTEAKEASLESLVDAVTAMLQA